MKRFLLFLSCVLAAMTAAAYDFTAMTAGETYTMEKGSTSYYSYTTATDGTFTINCSSAATVTIYSDEAMEDQVATTTNWLTSWEYSYEMSANTTYYFTIKSMSSIYDLTFSFIYEAAWTENDAKFTFDPADGQEVGTLTTIVVGYTGENLAVNYGGFSYKDVEVYKDGEKQSMTFSNTNFIDDGTYVTVKMPTAITDAGTYTIIFPKKTFIIVTNLSSGVTSAIDQETRVTYTVTGESDDDDDESGEYGDGSDDDDESGEYGDGEDGISAVAVDGTATTIYTISGQRVKAATTKGIYIIDGRTTIVK